MGGDCVQAEAIEVLEISVKCAVCLEDLLTALLP